MIGLELLRKTVDFFPKFAAGSTAGLQDGRNIELVPTKKKIRFRLTVCSLFLVAGVQLLAREARHFLLGEA